MRTPNRMRRYSLAVGVVVLGLAATACRIPSRYDVTTVLDGLENPWDAAFSSDGSMFFTERVGDVNVLRGGGAVTTFNRPPDVVQSGEGGMMGIAVDPAFDANRRIYTCYLTADDVRVVRWTVSGDWSSLGERADLITGIPRTSGRHSGCRVEFSPDGLLWATTGDAADADNPQNPASLAGKVLRITTDGGIPAGNMGAPFLPQIYAYGFRNPQGISFRPTDGVPFIVEHGPGCDDEITAVLAGGNGGWAPGPGYNEGVPMTDARLQNALAPMWRSGCPTIAPSGGTFVTSDSWGVYDGYMAVAVLKNEQLRLHNLNDGGDANGHVIVSGQGRLRTAVEAPNGSLYVLTDANPGRILLVQPVI